jgi:hypothetical protein
MMDGEQWRSRARSLLCYCGWDAMASREGENCNGEWLTFKETEERGRALPRLEAWVRGGCGLDQERG